MTKIYPLTILLLLAGITAAPAFSKPADKPSPKAINFSDYYPLEKGTFRKYTVEKPNAKKQTLTQVWTEGATYSGEPSVRTSVSLVEWDDEVLSGGQVLGFSGSDEFGNAVRFDPPLIKGMNDWKLGDRVTTLSEVGVSEYSEPFKLNLVLLGRGALSVSGKTYPDTIRVTFSINDGASEGMLWYARGVGMVKANYSDGEFWKILDHGKLFSLPPLIEKVYFEKSADKDETGIVIKGRNFEANTAVVILGKRKESLFSEKKGLIRIPGFQKNGEGLPLLTVINPDLQTALFEGVPASEPPEKVKPIQATP